MSFAKAFVTGTITKAPEKRFTQNDMAIASFVVKVDEATDTVLRAVCYGQLAETVSNTISTGDTVALEGKLQVNTHKLPNGKDKKVFEISANSVEKMGASNNATVSSNEENIVSFEEETAQDLIDEDEIPF